MSLNSSEDFELSSCISASVLFVVSTNFACAFGVVFARNVDSKIALDLYFADFALYSTYSFVFLGGIVPCVIVSLGLSLSLEH